MRAAIILMALLVVSAWGEDIPPADYAEPLPIMVVAGTPGEAKPEQAARPEQVMQPWIAESDAVIAVAREYGVSRLPPAPTRWTPAWIHASSPAERMRRTIRAEARRERLRNAAEARRER